MSETVLHIDSSARYQDSVTRNLTARIVAQFPSARVITRDLADTPLPQVTEDWVIGNATPEANQTAAQKKALELSDALVAELMAADTLVIGAPLYNFGVPAALKAWVDQVTRTGLTFHYTENGPKPLLSGKRAIIAMAAGGTQAGSPIDFATPYMRHILGFIGITDVTVIAADRMNIDPTASLSKALSELENLSTAA